MTDQKPFLTNPLIGINSKKKDIDYGIIIKSIDKCLKEKNPSAAKKIIDNLDQPYPDDDKFWQLHALVHHNLIELDQAIISYKKAIEINSKRTDCMYNLGLIYDYKSQHYLSLEYYKKAIQQKPENRLFWTKYANSLLQLGHYKDAEIAGEKALELEPLDHIEAINLMATIMIRLANYSKAKELLNESINSNENIAQTYVILGDIYSYEGEFQESEKYFRKALEIDTNNAYAFKTLTKMKKISSNDPLFIDMSRKFKDDLIPEKEKITIGFGISDVLDKENNNEKSFLFLKASNDLKRESLELEQIELMKNRIITAKKYFESNKLKFKSEENLTSNPMFIVGMPRSGTTLIAQILSSHSNVCGCDELTYIHDAVYDFYSKDIDINDIKSAADQYLSNINAHNPNQKEITIDKMPQNFLYIGFIKMMFPNTKIININRKPLDNFLSIYQQEFATGQFYSYSFQDIASVYDEYQNLMKLWRELFPDEIYDINYEDFISDIKINTDKLLNYCDLSKQESCYQFYNNNTYVQTASFYQIRQKPYKTSIDKWRNYQEFIKPLLNNFKKYV